MKNKLLKVKVFGAVQGVFFRHSARLKASELDLKGFVRNEDDGSVYVEAEGEKGDLDKFLEWCRQGPPPARVDRVEFSFREASGEFSDFDIK